MNQPSEESVTYLFSRSASFRVIHVNGVWGGVAPSGEIQLAFFVDRDPYPARVTHSVEDGRVGPEIRRKRMLDEGQELQIERELQVEVRLSLDQARTVRDWLDRYINQLSAALGAQHPNKVSAEG